MGIDARGSTGGSVAVETPPASRPGDATGRSPARGWLRVGLAAMAAAVIVVLLYGTLVEPRLIDSEMERVAVPHLPAAWEGQTLAVIADLQVGMWGANLGTVRQAVRQIVRQRPAAVLLAGDFIYKAERSLEPQVEVLRDLLRPINRAGIPVFATLGNHDWGLNWRHEAKRPALAAGVASALEEVGIRVLRNEAVVLRRGTDGAAMYVVGIGSAWAGEDRAENALSRVPPNAARVVFMHNPESFAKLPAGTAPLAIAAHTHGGQVALPFAPEWSWMELVRSEEMHVDGWIQGYGARGNHLYVNRGIGFSTLPIRINAMPEITWLELAAPPRQ